MLFPERHESLLEKREGKRKRKRKREGKKIPPPPPYGDLFTIQHNLRQDFGFEVDVGMLVDKLRGNGSITDGDYLLRSKESFKQSWEVPMRYPICFDNLSCWVFTDLKERIQHYIDSAKESQFFDADRMDRPEEMVEGFYLLYPAHPPHLNARNPILAKHPNLVNYATNLDKLAIAAVLCHNELTDSNLTFRRVVKSNIFCDICCHLYFITLEAASDNDGPLVICKSRVDCILDRADAACFHGKSRITSVCVDSFRVEKTF